MTLLQRLKDANRAIDPEESVPLRAAVFAAVMFAMLALVNEGVARGGVTALALLVVPVGFAASHRYRFRDLYVLKGLLAAGLVLVLLRFFADLGPVGNGNFVEVQIPLAELFLAVQALHALHVPARRDLMFALAASGVTLAIAGVVSVSMVLGGFIAAWVVAAVAALVLGQRSRLRAAGAPLAGDGDRSRRRPRVVRVAAAVAAIASAAFLLLPAARTSRALSFPVGLAAVRPLDTAGGLANPSLGDADPRLGRRGGGDFDTRAAFGYFGFTDRLDTGLRGRPDDTLVMRVRAPAPAFWRGQSFDTWDGRTWTIRDDTSRRLGGTGAIPIPPALGDPRFEGDEFVQTFHLETPGPNVVFGAAVPTEVYFPDPTLYQLGDGTLRAGVELGAGAVYTVVSSRLPITPELLRWADPLRREIPDAIAGPYLQLPELPDRVGALARAITTGADSAYDKVLALEAWMAANTEYTLDIPPLPAGTDAVEDFLFETRRGFCEQIGTSLVVMLRSVGVPARLAVGYTPGERNPFTGMFEVRASDAHAWAEVWFPQLGWVAFDPTAAVPLAGEFTGYRAGSGLAAWLGNRLPAAGLTVPARPVAAVLVLGIGGWLAAGWWRRRRSRRAETHYQRLRARLERIGRRCGRPRRPAETVGEYAAILARRRPDIPHLERLGGRITELGFGPGPPADDEVEHLLDEAERAARGLVTVRHGSLQSSPSLPIPGRRNEDSA